MNLRCIVAALFSVGWLVALAVVTTILALTVCCVGWLMMLLVLRWMVVLDDDATLLDG
jgi:hypothetical protein